MKKITPLVLLLISINLFAQSNTEIFLLDITRSNNKIELTNLRNISNSESYDNQPSFFDVNTVLFSSTRNGQTDLKSYSINNQSVSWLTNTSSGSEYSPLKIPNSEAISAIRLNNNGLQQLYQYDFVNKKSKVLLKDLKVGYHVWFNSTILVSSVLLENRLDLVISDIKDNTNHTIAQNVGRSLHKVPNSGLISFISNENNTSSIKSLDPISGNINTIKSLPIPIEDICWLTESIILIPNGKTIAQLNTTDDTISTFYSFEEEEINEISRISISPDNQHLVLVSEESPKIVVKKQNEAFNKGDLENFISCYSENVVVINYPNDTLYKGNSNLKTNYRKFFSKNNKSKVKVINRISNRNIVIEEQLITIDGKEHHQATLYEIKNGKIDKMYLIPEKQSAGEVEGIVQKQFNTWNAKDIDAFVKTFSYNIKVYEFQKELYADGQNQLYDLFSELFIRSPDLLCEISNRIVVGNIVIDKETISDKADSHEAIVIYEVANNKIFRMTTLNN